VLGILYLISPQFVINTATRALESVAANSRVPPSTTGRREAHFVNLDGTVRVKKAASLQWMRPISIPAWKRVISYRRQ